MRPRHYAGESLRHAVRSGYQSGGFNEAPALRRGKCVLRRRRGVAEAQASMRPRHYAGESRPPLQRLDPLKPASMRPRHYAGESRALKSAAQPDKPCFNEAPALRRGK